MKYFVVPLIYFIQGDITKHIKIGETCCGIEERISRLQAGSPDILNFLGACFAPMPSEKALHRKFKSQRLHGEWFLPSDELYEFINEKCFKDIWALYAAYESIKAGELTYNEALYIGDDGLIEMSNKKTMKTINSMYIQDGKNALHTHNK
ncbi:GIY-YIG nuclease family protein [bacterium SCSIO 12696]|nr:GIY-YIG nuclease family protein [bacterium SCSIO 12696]